MNHRFTAYTLISFSSSSISISSNFHLTGITDNPLPNMITVTSPDDARILVIGNDDLTDTVIQNLKSYGERW